jgi:hypothetical protein
MSHKTTSTHSENDSTGLDEASKLVDQITAIVGTVPALSAKDRKRSLKLRKGGETVIPTVAALSSQYGLSVASHPTTTMVSSAQKAQSLIPLYKKLVQATKQVADQMFTANSESWTAATVHYSMLKRLAKTNGDLETGLSNVEQFFARRSPEVVAERAAKRAAKKAADAAAAAPTVPAAATITSAPAPVVAPAKATPATTAAPATPAPTSTPIAQA